MLEREAHGRARRAARVAGAARRPLKAAGLAAATLASNAIALLFTVVFARLLGADGYGSLAALISTFLILAVPGSACRSSWRARSRSGALGDGRPAGVDDRRVAAARCSSRVAVVAAARCCCASRSRTCSSVERGVGGAATLPTGCLWLLLSIERGALQGVHAYREVGWSIVLEAVGRLVFGLVLVALGLGVTGRLPRHAAVDARDRRRARRDRRAGGSAADAAHAATRGCASSWRRRVAGVIGLFLVAVLQNVDVILVKRTIGGDAAGAYAAAAVAAKAVVWVAIGVGLYLLPEATRKARRGRGPAAGARARAGDRRARGGADAARLRGRAGAGAAARLRRGDRPGRRRAVRARAGDDAAGRGLPVRAVHARAARDALPVALGVVAVAEIVLLSGAGLSSIVGFATVVLGLQAIAALAVLALGLARRPVPGAARRPTAERRARRAPGVEGWLTDAQARAPARARGRGRAARSSRSAPSAGARRSCSARPRRRSSVVAIDPHAGSDRGPQEIAPTPRGEADHAAFHANLAAPASRRVRHVRKPSADALGDVDGPVALLYVDGAHRYAPARDDLARWGARVAPGGRCSSTTRSPRSA